MTECTVCPFRGDNYHCPTAECLAALEKAEAEYIEAMLELYPEIATTEESDLPDGGDDEWNDLYNPLSGAEVWL